MIHYETIGNMHYECGFPPPEHPQISLQRGLQPWSLGKCRSFITDFYIIAFKKLKSGAMMYGRTKCDPGNGIISFTKPRRIMQSDNPELEEGGFRICIHEDFLNGHFLRDEIRKYNFFDYEINGALHLSPDEQQVIMDLYDNIDTEYNNNQDEYSRAIMLAHINSILKYSQRFYKRQFINRAALSGKTTPAIFCAGRSRILP